MHVEDLQCNCQVGRGSANEFRLGRHYMDNMVLQVSDAGDGEGVDDALVRLEVPTFGGGEVLGLMSRWQKESDS